jgi:hypothetical protein
MLLLFLLLLREVMMRITLLAAGFVIGEQCQSAARWVLLDLVCVY